MEIPGVIISIQDGDPITETISDEYGYYSAWLFPGDYDFEFYMAGYLPVTVTVEVIEGNEVELNVNLVPDRACIAINPTVIETWILTGTETYTVPGGITLTNDGGQELSFNIVEEDGGYFTSSLATASSALAPLPAVSVPGSASTLGRTHMSRSEMGGALKPEAWSSGTPYPGDIGIVRYAHAQCQGDNNSFYLISGVEDGLVVDDNYRYEADNGTWTALAPIPNGREGPVAVCYDGKIYVIGGGPAGNPDGAVYIYDIASDSWSMGAFAPRNAWGAAAGAYDGKIYYAGGANVFGGGGYSDEVNIYDIASNSWSGNGSDIPSARVIPGYLQLGNYLYVVGGWGN
jgi:hypothetical protein